MNFVVDSLIGEKRLVNKSTRFLFKWVKHKAKCEALNRISGIF